MSDGRTIPALPCVSLPEALDFYRLLGFEVVYEQKSPNPYGVVGRDGYVLHLFGLKGLRPENGYSTCLVIVPEVERLHKEFAEGLRRGYGKLPIAGFPRITRMRKGQGRFTVTDPSGNSVIFVKENADDGPSYEELSGLEKAIEAAGYLRDSKGDDRLAAKTLDVALERHPDAPPVERARALAARAELAVALGEMERLAAVRAELARVPLSAEDRERLRDELHAADELEKTQS